jgi:hypothetical protein
MMPMTKLPPITKLPKASMTWPAACVPSWPWQDQARRGEVERQPQHGRDQQHGREGGEFQRRWMNSAVIRISTEKRDRDREQPCRAAGGSGRIRTIRRMGAVAQAVARGVEDQVALDVGDGAADQPAHRLSAPWRRPRRRPCRAGRCAPGAERHDGLRPDELATRGQQHGAMQRVLELAHVARPGWAQQPRAGVSADPAQRPLASAYFFTKCRREQRCPGPVAQRRQPQVTTLRR